MKKNKLKIKLIPFQYRHVSENVSLYPKIDGRYHSYWLGKFFNFFIKKGKKYMVYKHLYLCFLIIKYSKNLTPLLYWFEILEQIKPTFKLTSIFPNKKMVVYPRVILGSKQYKITLRWLREITKYDYEQTRKDKIPFYRVILSSFEFLNSSNNKSLLKKRDNYLSDAIRLQDHIRYTWVKG